MPMPPTGCAGGSTARPRSTRTAPFVRRSWAAASKAELDRDPERLGVAVLIKIDKITELSGEVLQQRDAE